MRARIAIVRQHGRGGALLIVPSDTGEWLESMVTPMLYAVQPPYTELSSLSSRAMPARRQPREQIRQISVLKRKPPIAKLFAPVRRRLEFLP